MGRSICIGKNKRDLAGRNLFNFGCCRDLDRKVSRDAINTEAVLANCVDMSAPGRFVKYLN